LIEEEYNNRFITDSEAEYAADDLRYEASIKAEEKLFTRITSIQVELDAIYPTLDAMYERQQNLLTQLSEVKGE
jgi:hypothetical protein